MQTSRRRFLSRAIALGVGLLPRAASSQKYPSRPIRLIVPFPVGGVVDLYGRIFGRWLSDRLSQTVIVENRAGAGGNIGTGAAVRSAPDGYTLLQLSSVNAWNVSLYEKLSFDLLRDITPIASIHRSSAILVVHPSFEVNSVPELIAYAKAHPNKVNMASAGVGTAPHVYGELFKAMAGVDLQHVPYRGGGLATQDLLAGHVPLMFETFGTGLPHVIKGELRALAVTSSQRSELLPDVPAIAEFVAGYEGIGWQGIAAPVGLPEDVVQRLHDEVNAALDDPRIRARMRELGATVFKSTAAEFKVFIAEYTAKWGRIIKAANIKAE
jgi:tripartite-type tricarboxylate transporter receptor subunit TctC